MDSISNVLQPQRLFHITPIKFQVCLRISLSLISYFFQARSGCLQYVYPELQSLHKFLEVDFHPLSLYKKVQPIVSWMEGNSDLSVYVPQLEDIIVTRVLKQVGNVVVIHVLYRFFRRIFVIMVKI